MKYFPGPVLVNNSVTNLANPNGSRQDFEVLFVSDNPCHLQPGKKLD